MSLTFELSQSLHQWLVVAAVLATMVVLAMERKPIELTALAVLVFLLLFYSFFPVLGPEGNNLLGPGRLLSGFANPSLIAVLCLLVIGQAMIQTDALTPITNMLLRLSSIHPLLTIAVALLGVLLISAALNNTPIVVMFIPVMQSMAQRLDWPASRIMMPLSYAAILGGSVTLIGSSTNLLVSSTMVQLGEAPIGFFDFTVPGLILGAVGLVYVLVILPRLLPERASMAMEWLGEGKQFIAEINATEDSPLVGQKAVGGVFPKMPDMTVRLVQRGGMVILPPFENYTIRAGDVLIVAATRHALTELLSRTKGFFVSEETGASRRPPRPPRPPAPRGRRPPSRPSICSPS